MKKQDLNAFDLYDYLKAQHAHDKNIPFFLANQDTYKAASIQFPLRNFIYGIGITYSGDSGLVKIGSDTYPVRAGSLITIGPGTVSKWLTNYSAEHDTLFFTEELFDKTIKLSNLKTLPFFRPEGKHVIMLDDEKVNRIKVLFDAVKEFQNDYDIIPGLVYSILLFTVNCHKLHTADQLPNQSRHEKITQEFTALLTDQFLKERTVNFYADKLNITPKHLSEVLIKTTGKGAKGHIVDLIIAEAKSLLKQTDMSVKEIASWLGYADPSYFTKLFKEQVRVTPLAYKQQ